ncbi:hypothetical protein FNX24_21635 [Salmonella enterica]|nr:hypothetical protein [Salmonella enterica]
MFDEYVVRNRAWILPLLGGLLISVSTIALEIVTGSAPIPVWVSLTIACLGFFASGIGAAFTDTFSARIVKTFAVILLITILILMIYKLVNNFN